VYVTCTVGKWFAKNVADCLQLSYRKPPLTTVITLYIYSWANVESSMTRQRERERERLSKDYFFLKKWYNLDMSKYFWRNWFSNTFTITNRTIMYWNVEVFLQKIKDLEHILTRQMLYSAEDFIREVKNI
jgi:hypothetical protein